MKMAGIGLLLAGFLLPHATTETIADEEFDARAKAGIDYIYNLEFERADQVFEELIRLRPRDPAGHFFRAMVSWWRIMLDLEDTRYDEQLLEGLDRVIELCDELLDQNENDVNALFFKGGAYGFQGRLRFNRDDWFAAANAGRKALPIVQDASAADPNNFDVFLGTGIYNYYAEIIPERYPIAKPLLLFIPQGDKKKGIEQLHVAAEKGKYASIEAHYFLMQLYYLYEREYAKSSVIANNLHQRFPNNMLFHKYVGRCAIALNNYPAAREVFSEIMTRIEQKRPGYNKATEREAEYYLGLCDMNAKSYDAALGHFYRCDELSRSLDNDGSSGFMVMANLNVGKIYDVQAKRNLAVAQYRKVLDMKEFKDSYTQAERFLDTPYTQ